MTKFDWCLLALVVAAWCFPYHRVPKRWRDVPRWSRWR